MNRGNEKNLIQEAKRTLLVRELEGTKPINCFTKSLQMNQIIFAKDRLQSQKSHQLGGNALPIKEIGRRITTGGIGRRKRR